MVGPPRPPADGALRGWHRIVAKGELELTLGDEVIKLHERDSYTFDGRIEHHARNRTDREAVLVWAVSQVVIRRQAETRDRLAPDRQLQTT